VLFVAAVGMASLILSTPPDGRRRAPRGPERPRAGEPSPERRERVPVESGEVER
jgi:hypothetical protein